ncbi:MAG: hypothetical protein F6K19_06020 [Cyanothece sp. SIO1E1]|nr:hypothetical protein [Cyanothece sp. SIO1E1]
MSEAMRTTIDSNRGYPIFVPDQVLSSDDLNALVEYFDSQSLLTRSQLMGQGIVRGLVIASNLSPTTITVTQGIGITANGQLIILENDITLAYYDANHADTNGTGLTPIELFKRQGKHHLSLRQHIQDGKPIDRSDAELQTLFETHVLLVLRDQADSTRPAKSLSYNEMGKDRQFYLRFFLMPKDEVELLQDPANALEGLTSTIAHPAIHRFGYQESPGEGPDAQPISVVQPSTLTSYQAIQANYATICEQAIASLSTAIPELFSWMKNVPLLSIHLAPIADLDALATSLQDQLTAQLTDQSNAPYGIQYFYDYLSQMVTAYRELADAVFEFTSDRPPAPTPATNYLLLGIVKQPEPNLTAAVEAAATVDPYRHHFVSQSVTDAATKRQIDQVCYLQERLVRLYASDSFSLPPSQDTSIQLTPSGDRTHTLDQQAIPYYLNYENLYSHWNYDAYRQGKSQYHPAYKSPYANFWLYRLDRYPFYRIEGHLGKPSHEALRQIEVWRDRYNLAFEVIKLKINLNTDSALEAKPPRSESDDKHLFHHFANSHPGLEHLGGVPKGGTFILVYAELAAAENASSDDAPNVDATDIDTTDLVVADFCLPYRYLRAPTVTLDPLVFCENDEILYEFELEPAGGILLGDGSFRRGDKYYFQPSRLQPAIVEEQSLSFVYVVNNQCSALSVVVYAQPDATFMLNSTPDLYEFYEDDPPVDLVPNQPGGTFRALQLDESSPITDIPEAIQVAPSGESSLEELPPEEITHWQFKPGQVQLDTADSVMVEIEHTIVGNNQCQDSFSIVVTVHRQPDADPETETVAPAPDSETPATPSLENTEPETVAPTPDPEDTEPETIPTAPELETPATPPPDNLESATPPIAIASANTPSAQPLQVTTQLNAEKSEPGEGEVAISLPIIPSAPNPFSPISILNDASSSDTPPVNPLLSTNPLDPTELAHPVPADASIAATQPANLLFNADASQTTDDSTSFLDLSSTRKEISPLATSGTTINPSPSAAKPPAPADTPNQTGFWGRMWRNMRAGRNRLT